MPRLAPAPVTNLEPRARAAQKAVNDARAHLEQELELRRRIVVEAVDQGVPYRTVGAWLGLGTGAVSKIVATPEPPEGE